MKLIILPFFFYDAKKNSDIYRTCASKGILQVDRLWKSILTVHFALWNWRSSIYNQTTRVTEANGKRSFLPVDIRIIRIRGHWNKKSSIQLEFSEIRLTLVRLFFFYSCTLRLAIGIHGKNQKDLTFVTSFGRVTVTCHPKTDRISSTLKLLSSKNLRL